LRLLLDTHILLWWAGGSPKLGAKARTLIATNTSVLSMSAASWWEIAIKQTMGRLHMDMARARREFMQRGVTPLAVTFDHAEAAAALPRHHTDPFDRMLVAQAEQEGMKLLTRNKSLKAYGSAVLHV
jgi:PIN domain nuclease of toxin-antitoxin system